MVCRGEAPPVERAAITTVEGAARRGVAWWFSGYRCRKKWVVTSEVRGFARALLGIKSGVLGTVSGRRVP